jgi:hypothetical protein
MQPKVMLNKLERKEVRFKEERSNDKENEKNCMNIRRVLYEEIHGDILEIAEDMENMRHEIIDETRYQDETHGLMYPRLILKWKFT